jgi:glycosyltransferase involved in cell wall biosynthesis
MVMDLPERCRVVLHVADQVDRTFGGLANSIPSLCAAQIRSGEEVVLASLNELPDARRFSFGRRFDYVRMPWLHAYGFSPSLRRWMSMALESGAISIVHSHSLWRFPNVAAPRMAARQGVPCVVSPHGTLGEDPFSQGSRAKRLVWHLLQRKSLSLASGFHAASEQESDEIRMRGFTQPIAIVPLGFEPAPIEHARDFGGRSKEVLTLGRIDEKKGVDLLLMAWRRLEPKCPEWRLRIVGPDEGGHRRELQKLAERLGLRSVVFEEGVRGMQKWEALAGAAVFVLPSKNENFGLVVAEALSSGTPVISTTGTPWKRVSEIGGGWWIERTEDALVQALTEAMRLWPDGLQDMGSAGSTWVRQEFSWQKAANALRNFYDWILAGQTRRDAPAFVRLD